MSSRRILPPRPVNAWTELSTEERLELADALQQALDAGSGVTRVQTPEGIAWDITPASVTLLTTGTRQDPLWAKLQRPLHQASAVDILAAFVMQSGVAEVLPALRSALQRGAKVRVLTGDYLATTQTGALRTLLDLAAEAEAGEGEEQPCWPGRLELRVVEAETLHRHQATTFHPKAWILRGPQGGVAFVGSSNLSRAALRDGLEWNLGLYSRDNPEGFARVLEAFETLWSLGAVPTSVWLDAYEARERAARATRQALHPPATRDEEALPPPPSPRPVQAQALEALASARQEGARRALIVMATGLGKTWLAALDVLRLTSERPGLRVLFIAHRVELLRQAAETFRRALPHWGFSWCVADQDDLSGQLVLASVQKLTREIHRLAPDAFDYVVLDEVHHAPAPSYQNILKGLKPGFLLGLTATPERGDGRHAQALFGGRVLFQATLRDGILQGALAPLAYYGLRDPTDYTPIPWRGGRFELLTLTSALQTEQRMKRLGEALKAHPGHHTLLFCCTRAHARFTADWLQDQLGLRVACVHSGGDSADRFDATRRLQLPPSDPERLDALCVVDLFNEGVDLPAIDRVVFLRPTESPVIFLQQLGRGLRIAPDKKHLTVIDFVGNHHSFLDRHRVLLSSLLARSVSLDAAITSRLDASLLPPGCAVDLELEAVDLLQALRPQEQTSLILRSYRRLAALSPTRPRALDLFARGFAPQAIRGGWLHLLEDEGDLTDVETETLRTHAAALKHLLTAPVSALPTLPSQPPSTPLETLSAEVLAWRHATAAHLPDAFPHLKSACTLVDSPPRLVSLHTSFAPPEGLLMARSPDGATMLLHVAPEGHVTGVWSAEGHPRPLAALHGLRLHPAPEGWWLEPCTPRPDALSPSWREAAEAMTADLWARHPQEFLGEEPHRFQLVARSAQGGLRLQPEHARRPRSISTTDLGWVLLAQDEACRMGAPEVLDVGLVHRLRYPPGTRRASTRYIDTGWAIRLAEIHTITNTTTQ